MNTITVVLTEFEYETAQRWGKDVYNRMRGKSKVFEGNQADQLAKSIRGIAGELAASKAVNLYPRSLGNQQKGDHADLSYRGKRIDVKTVAQIGDLLIYPSARPGDADIYLSVLEHNKYTYEVIGWAPEAEALKPERMVEPGPGSPACYVTRRHELRPVDSLTGGDL